MPFHSLFRSNFLGDYFVLQFMSIKKLLAGIIFVFSALNACNALANSPVWKVSQGTHHFYLGATIHLLSEDDYPLPKEFDIAYNDSEKLFFETDLNAAQSPEFQSKFLEAMMFNDGRTLESELTPEMYRQLAEFLAARQIPIAGFSRFQPWGVSLMLSILEYQRLGMMSNFGVDTYFHNKAVADHKKTMFLETPEEQINFLKSMGKVDPDTGISYTMRDLARLPEFINLIKENWRSGNVKALATNAFVIQMKEEFPAIYQTLITNRNRTWMQQLPSLLHDEPTEFVLVGAMHLSGEDGLLAQLQATGLLVEQL